MPWKQINGRETVIPPNFSLNLVETKHGPEVAIYWRGHGSATYSELDLLCLLAGKYGRTEFDEDYIYWSALDLLRGEAPKYWEKGSITKNRPSKPGNYPININPIKTRKKRSSLSRLWDRLRRLSK